MDFEQFKAELRDAIDANKVTDIYLPTKEVNGEWVLYIKYTDRPQERITMEESQQVAIRTWLVMHMAARLEAQKAIRKELTVR